MKRIDASSRLFTAAKSKLRLFKVEALTRKSYREHSQVESKLVDGHTNKISFFKLNSH